MNPKRRLAAHLRDASSGRDKTRCGHWKREVLAAGRTPLMVIVDEGVYGGYVSAEQKWIAHFREKFGDRLTNLTLGGDGTLGRVNSPEHRAKISAYRKGRKASPETLHKMRQAQLGRKQTPEWTAKIAAKNRGRKMPEAEKARRRGKKMSPEAVAKSAAARIGMKRSPEVCAKMRVAHLGVPLTAEHAKNAAKAHRGLSPSIETRAKISAAIKEHHKKHPRKMSPEARAKISAGVKVARNRKTPI